MVERGKDLRLALESREPVRISGEHFGKNFDRDVAVKLRIARAVDLAHSAGAERREDLVHAEAHSGAK